MNPLARAAAATVLIAALFACEGGSTDPSRTPPIAPGESVTANATIQFLNIEGGCWVVVTSAGQRYEPVNLDAAFRTDGLQVQVVLRDAPGLGSICQVGPLVTVESIQPA